MPEKIEKKNKKNKLGLVAGAVMLAGLSSAAESYELNKNETLSSLDRREFSKTERKVLENKLALRQQVQFVEHALKTAGVYERELKEMSLAPERLSQIFSLVNAVSARLTIAFATQPDRVDMETYATEVEVLRSATSSIETKRRGAPVRCNGFAMQNNGEAYLVTAKHCVEGTDIQKEYFYPENTDVAVKYVAKEQWAAYNIKNIDLLPLSRADATPANINGRVITAFSRTSSGKEKVHFSFAMPMPANKLLVFNKDDLDAFASHGVSEFMMFFKPYSEGQVRPEDGRINAAGSSGGPVLASGFGILGNYSATKEIADTCKNVCYATSFFTRPDVMQRAIEGERVSRTKRKTAARE